MFKNKKIKKLFSVICTVLTLNSTSSVFQHNPSAIKFETTYEDGYEVETITLDKPFYCIVVYDKPDINYKDQQTTWDQIPLADLIFNGADVHEPNEVKTLHVSAKEYINKMQKFLNEVNEVSDESELLIVVCLTDQKDLYDIPPLPYSFMATPQLKSPDVMQALKKQLNEQTFQHLVFPDNDRKKLITLETTIYKDSADLIREYTLTQDKPPRKTYDTGNNQPKPRNELWHLKAPGRIMTVRELKSWLTTYNPDLLQQAIRTTNTISHPSTNQKPSSNKPHINPPPALHNDENKAQANSGFTLANKYNFELDDLEIPLVENLMNDADYKEEIIPTTPSTYYPYIGEPGSYGYEDELKTTIFSKTKKFVHKNPKTSVGIGAAVLTLGATIIYKIKKLFTRESKKSQDNNQINQKYNQYVKNKV